MVFKFDNGGAQKAPTEAVKVSMEGPFPTFWAVEDPVIIQDSIPRELRTLAQKSVNTVPQKTVFQTFESFDLATAYAQRQNRPLLVLEMSVTAKVVPQIPTVEAIKSTK